MNWIGSGFSGNFMDWIGLSEKTVAQFFIITKLQHNQLMPFLSNYELRTFNYPCLTTILSQHYDSRA